MKTLFLESLPYVSDFRVGSHHYADRFMADGYDGMWVSHPFSPLHLMRSTKREMPERMRGWREGPVAYGRMRYYSPLTMLPTAHVPILDSRFVARHSSRACVPHLGGVIARAGFAQPDVLWLTNPVYQPLAARLDRACLAVRIADDHSQFRDVPPAIRELEAAAIRDADVVFAVSGSVFQRLSAERDNVVRLPNAVDADHFARPRPEPHDLAGLPRPRAIYVGALEYWFDADLLERCALARPDVPFVVIGPRPDGVPASVATLPNVHLLGPRPYAEIPAYLQHCDVGIVPFRRDALVDSIHPIKVYEYLAAGLRVVATRWTELEEMGAPVALAETDDFIPELERALDEPETVQTAEARLSFARANSWDARYAVVSAHLRHCLGR